MLKTISAALLAASMIAAPAFAAGIGTTAAFKSATAKTEQAPAINGAQAKTSTKTSTKIGALHANARMRRHHHKNHEMGALKLKKNHAKVGYSDAAKKKLSKTKLSKVHLGKTNAHVSKTQVSKAHVSKIHAKKFHSKVSLKHAAPAIKRG